MYSSWSVRNSLSSCSMYIFEHCPLPPMSTSHPLTWWMLPDLPCFLPSFRSQVLLQMQTESKSGAGLGTRLLTTYCKFVNFFQQTLATLEWSIFIVKQAIMGEAQQLKLCTVKFMFERTRLVCHHCHAHDMCGMHARGLAANSWIFFNKL